MPVINNAIWVKNTQNNEWFDLLRLDLDSSYFIGKKGVFMIWYVAPGASRVIKIGSGNLTLEIKKARSNPQVLELTKNGPLKVSWVLANGAMTEAQMPGVETYLYNVYGPLLGERPMAPLISINKL